jgi:hypothetical protein
MRRWRPNPPAILIHGVALVGIQIPTTPLTGRPPSARMTFFEEFKLR